MIVPAGPARGGDGTLALRRIANRPIACHAVESLVQAGIDDVSVIAPAALVDEARDGMEADLAEGGVGATFLSQTERIDLLGALRAAAGFVRGAPAVLHLADGLLGQQLDQVIGSAADDMPDLRLLLHRGDDESEGLAPVTQRLLGLTELGGSRSRLAVTGVCVFGPGALESAAAAADDVGPELDLIEVAEDLAARGGRVDAAVVRGWRRYQGNPLDLLELNRIVLDRQTMNGEVLDRGDNRIEGRVVIHPSAEVTSSVLLGPCIIGPHAKVTGAYIGPYTSIGAGAEIEGAEIVRSIVSEGVRIRHIAGRIEGSTIGRRASIFRDFRLPRAMRLHVGEDVEVALD